MIDASKAFDKVCRDGLFYKLNSLNINKAEWRFLYNYYASSKCFVELKSTKYVNFKPSVGVKQGGPLSPFLYNIYTQDRIERIESLKVADDIILVSPIKSGIKKMLKYVSDYLKTWKIQMNKKKTNYMIVDKENEKNCKIEIDGEEIAEVNEIKYLGVTIDNNLQFNNHVNTKNKQMNKSCFSLYNT